MKIAFNEKIFLNYMNMYENENNNKMEIQNYVKKFLDTLPITYTMNYIKVNDKTDVLSVAIVDCKQIYLYDFVFE